jgi:hypothetical protein
MAPHKLFERAPIIRNQRSRNQRLVDPRFGLPINQA